HRMPVDLDDRLAGEINVDRHPAGKISQRLLGMKFYQQLSRDLPEQIFARDPSLADRAQGHARLITRFYEKFCCPFDVFAADQEIKIAVWPCSRISVRAHGEDRSFDCERLNRRAPEPVHQAEELCHHSQRGKRLLAARSLQLLLNFGGHGSRLGAEFLGELRGHPMFFRKMQEKAPVWISGK